MNFRLLFMSLAAVSWGTIGTTMVLLNQSTPLSPLLVGFWRVAIASPLLLLAASRNQKLWRIYSSQELKVYLALGACMAVYQVTFLGAVPLAGVAITALVAMCSVPLFITGLAVKFLREPLHTRTYISLGLGVVGVCLLVAQPQSVAFSNTASNTALTGILGIGLALLSGFVYAVYVIIAKVNLAQMETLTVTAFSFTTSAFLLSPVLILQVGHLTWVSLPFLIYLGVVPTSLAYIFYMVSLKQTSAITAGIVVLLEPLTATLLGVFALGEPLFWTGILGAILLVGAIGICFNCNQKSS